jgi:hypothetical protein
MNIPVSNEPGFLDFPRVLFCSQELCSMQLDNVLLGRVKMLGEFKGTVGVLL